MGRAGIAMTFVTEHELKDVDSLVKGNRIGHPVWHGAVPNLQAVPKDTRRQDGKRFQKKQAGRKRQAPPSFVYSSPEVGAL